MLSACYVPCPVQSPDIMFSFNPHNKPVELKCKDPSFTDAKTNLISL